MANNLRLVLGKVSGNPEFTPGLYGIFWRGILWFGDEWVGVGIQMEGRK